MDEKHTVGGSAILAPGWTVVTTRLTSQRERVEFETFVSELLSQPTPEAVKDHLADLVCPDPYRIRIKVLYSSRPLIEIIQRPRARIELEPLGDAGVAFALKATIGRGETREVSTSLVCLPTRQPNVTAVVSVCPRQEGAAVLGFLKRHYPRGIPIYLSQRELLQAVLDLRRSSREWEFRVRGLSGREPIADSSPRRTRSVREWTDQDLEGALGLIAERKRTLNSVTLALHKRLGNVTDAMEAARARITQQGEVDLNARFSLLWDSVVRHVAEVGQLKLDRFGNRGLRDTQYRSASLAIQFSSPVLQDVGQVRKLVGLLRRYPSSMHAVRHGNPYANVRVTDRYDGSSFDVWAVDANRVILIPGLKASRAAIGRLVHYISNSFMEGEVVEFSD